MLNCIGNHVEHEVYGKLEKTSNAGTAIGVGLDPWVTTDGRTADGSILQVTRLRGRIRGGRNPGNPVECGQWRAD